VTDSSLSDLNSPGRGADGGGVSAGERGLEGLVRALENERGLLEHLRFRFVGLGLVLDNREVRFLEWAMQDLEASRARVREADLVRAAEVGLLGLKAAQGIPTLREVAAVAPPPWARMLRDHHDGLGTVVTEIELHGHRIAQACRAGLAELAHTGTLDPHDVVPALVPTGTAVGGCVTTTPAPEAARLRAPGQGEDLDPGSIEVLLGTTLRTAGRLRLPSLLAFLR
jgi:hypothetical protein